MDTTFLSEGPFRGALRGLERLCRRPFDRVTTPEAFFATPGYDGSPLVMLRLAQVNVARLKELVTDAWRMRAPDALVGDLAAVDHLSDADHGRFPPQ